MNLPNHAYAERLHNHPNVSVRHACEYITIYQQRWLPMMVAFYSSCGAGGRQDLMMVFHEDGLEWLLENRETFRRCTVKNLVDDARGMRFGRASGVEDGLDEWLDAADVQTVTDALRALHDVADTLPPSQQAAIAYMTEWQMQVHNQRYSELLRSLKEERDRIIGDKASHHVDPEDVRNKWLKTLKILGES